jgi:hypothetical protein
VAAVLYGLSLVGALGAVLAFQNEAVDFTTGLVGIFGAALAFVLMYLIYRCPACGAHLSPLYRYQPRPDVQPRDWLTNNLTARRCWQCDVSFESP